MPRFVLSVAAIVSQKAKFKATSPSNQVSRAGIPQRGTYLIELLLTTITTLTAYVVYSLLAMIRVKSMYAVNARYVSIFVFCALHHYCTNMMMISFINSLHCALMTRLFWVITMSCFFVPWLQTSERRRMEIKAVVATSKEWAARCEAC